MAMVTQAEDLKLGCAVALKLIAPRFRSTQLGVARFFQETWPLFLAVPRSSKI
jgi:hypothetical protein